MKKGRLEAFSDGVIAIIITIMVLELKVPHSADIKALEESVPVFLSYLLSFIYVGIYWNNHHHMLYLVEKINGRVLWANLSLLFFLSLIPFVTAWMGENHFAKWPVIFYGFALLANAIAYSILALFLVADSHANSPLADAIGKDWKGKASIVIYITGIVAAFQWPIIGMACYIIVAMIWFIPDNRIERRVSER
ncbi:TMEM175 family protein [Mucilaginibacter ginkgonis]|uniref:DUF1211 domain-containing protein n=1 Tax=Mucilaginibacter ginkgonis TaxID=2682091 RepID=A0A6I4I0D9_9SPHI|nr:TMEM175 family protein [Mucilaginibacter ginkgonis]QQL50939.1 DUF1211 domain-containing protein [Mucilaginibacter ginkgonis]